MEFSLFEILMESNALQIALLVICAAAAAALIFLLAKKKPVAERSDPRALIYGAMCISIAFVLSYLRFFRMPQGGSITLCSMLPVMVYSYWFGARSGLIAGLAYGVLQYLQDPQFFHPVQVLLDYGLAFPALAIAGLFPKRLLPGMAAAGLGRILCHVASGAIFFAAYAPEGQNPWVYSLGYNLSTIGPDLLLCLVAASIPQLRRFIESSKGSIGVSRADTLGATRP